MSVNLGLPKRPLIIKVKMKVFRFLTIVFPEIYLFIFVTWNVLIVANWKPCLL